MHADADYKTLTDLNELYIRCVIRADAEQFETILADDFLCSNPDGSLLDRQEFLNRVRGAVPLEHMDISDVRIRILDSVAIIHAKTSFASIEGKRGIGRYTDVWARRDGKWLAVSAHVTRL